MIPVRVLTELSIYHKQTRELVPVAELLSSTTEYGISGNVRPHTGDDSEDEEDEDVDEDISSHYAADDIQRIALDNILEFNYNHFDEDTGPDW